MHQVLGLPAPKHPLITMVQKQEIPEASKNTYQNMVGMKLTSELFSIAYKDKVSGSMTYGRNSYDFQNGTLVFMAPDQVVMGGEFDIVEDDKSWMILFHPDLIRGSQLGNTIDSYSFFGYGSNEALHVSEEEQEYLGSIAKQVKREYSQNLDIHSHQLILSNLELLLNNCLRYYDRQFYTRTSFNQDFVAQFEHLLKEYFSTDLPVELGLPSVKYFSDQLAMSPNYLSDLLKKATGSSAKEHINKVVIDRAKGALLSSHDSISEIAYGLGFEHPQSLTRLFKSKTGMSPIEYRNLN